MDEDADGMIDMVELTLSKPLNLTDFHLWLSWENGNAVQVEWSNLAINASETVVRAEIKGLLTGDSIITSGKMSATATHNKFPGDTLRANVADKAAPVVKWAQFCPGSEGQKDSLIVTFSEPLLAASARPFVFKYGPGPNNTLYSMTLQNDTPTRVSPTHTFIVNAIEGAEEAPTKNDSLWIRTEVIYDTSANIQSNENNHRVKLSIKPAPITIKVIPAPNPYKPGSGNQPINIIVRPIAKAVGELNIRGSIAIYDNMGNIVLTDTLRPRENSLSDLVYTWDGHSKRGRKVGTGTYLISVSVEHVLEAYEEKVKAITGRAMIYILR